MNVNIEIVFRDIVKNDFMDLRGLWFGWQYGSELELQRVRRRL